MPDNITTVNSANFEETVLKSELPAVLYFYSDDCLPCINFSRIFERMAPSLEGRIKFFKVFRQHERELADRLSVKFSPTVIFYKGGSEICKRLTGYISFAEFKDAIESVLGEKCNTKERSVVNCDVLIIGAGPAGLTSALYTARSRLYTAVVDSGIPGGQVASTFHISNYPGTNGVIRGIDLMENMARQASDFGAQIYDMQSVTEIDLDKDEKLLKTEQNDFRAKSVIIAAGAEPRRLPVAGEREFRGRGVHYCATCDGAMYMDADITVVGGGASALDEAIFLTRYAKSVTILNRSDKFKSAGTPVESVLKIPRIKVVWNTEVTEIKGEKFIESIAVKNTRTGETGEMKTDGLFVYIGTQPNSSLFAKSLKLSEDGYIITEKNMHTGTPGVFAAGDIRKKDIRQITTAVGDGTIAGIMAERFIREKYPVS